MEKQYCLRSVHLSPVNDYLHPKYSLPPVKMNIADSQVNITFSVFSLITFRILFGFMKIRLCLLLNQKNSFFDRITP